MREKSVWNPHLAAIDAALPQRLAQALADDITQGKLALGVRLPAHRDLAWRLGISVATVTKAYAILDSRGLTESIRGRGTFVTTSAMHDHELVDMSVNSPPALLGDRLLAKTLTAVSKNVTAQLFNGYSEPFGHLEHRRLLAAWLGQLGVEFSPCQLVLTSGAQQALSLAFDLACQGSGVVFTERVTYPGGLALARSKGLKLFGLEIDRKGIIPDDLEAQLTSKKNVLRKTLYVTPTSHNPTAYTSSGNRRRQIADICRRHNVTIVEDAVYVFERKDDQPSFATLLPDQTYFVSSFSKIVSPGLKIALLGLPASMIKSATELLGGLTFAPSAVSCAIMENWFSNGTMATIAQSLRSEIERRSALALNLLGNSIQFQDSSAFHIWMPMSIGRANALVAAARDDGVLISAPHLFLAKASDQRAGVRLCLGNVTRKRLELGLCRIADIKDRLTASMDRPKRPR
jgi:DNA-binding transcriptional MocR family regulator